MKKENKLKVLKSLITAVFLILGNTALAQHPLLGPDELNVYVLPDQQQITIGKQAYDEGRTCYKWNGPFTSADENEERIGSLQVFGKPSYMTTGSNVEFELTVIGEQYYQQTVTVHVGYNITFEVYPKRGCISGNEMPQIEDFDIETNPSGFEYLVGIAGMSPHTPNQLDGYFDVLFELVMDGVVLDQKTVTIINTDYFSRTKSCNLDAWMDLANGIGKVVGFIGNGFKRITGTGVTFDPLTPMGGWTITDGLDCCETTMQQKKIDIDHLGFKCGMTVDAGINLLYALTAGVRGELRAEVGIRDVHNNLYRTCGPFTSEHSLYGGISASIGVFIEDITGGAVLSATAKLVDKFSIDAFKVQFTGTSILHTYGVLNADIYLESEFKLCSFYQTKYTTTIVKESFPLVYNIIVN